MLDKNVVVLLKAWDNSMQIQRAYKKIVANQKPAISRKSFEIKAIWYRIIRGQMRTWMI